MGERSRFDELREQCQVWHGLHPEVWEMFERFTFDRINRDFENYSAYAIFEHIRWHMAKPKVDGEVEFKLNNNYRPFYSRRFMAIYPEHEGFFRVRTQTSKDHDPTGMPELGPKDFN